MVRRVQDTQHARLPSVMSSSRPITRPVIGIPTDRRMVGHHPFHMAGEKYMRALIDAAGAIPVLIPALGSDVEVHEILSRLDGLLLPGSPSNVEPHHYEGLPSEAGTLHDPARDSTTLPLIRAAVADAVPLFGICRGFQEMNVAFGGSLTQKLHEVPGYLDHRDKDTDPLDIQYGPAHDVLLESGGLLRELAETDRVRVNSLHWQGVDRLGRDLSVEARAPDGVVEAFRVKDSPSFALAVQWHPEWKVMNNPFSRALFAAFGAASRQRAANR